MSIKWIFFDIGSTLVDESECYEVRYKETTHGTNVSYQKFKDKALNNKFVYNKNKIIRKSKIK